MPGFSEVDDPDPVLVEVVRAGFTESVHRGRVAVVDADGSLLAAVGEPFAPMYPRSASKPLQAVGMLRGGLDLDGELLALVCASHSGEEFHQEGVRRILAGAGLTVEALQTPPDWPLDDPTKESVIRAGGTRTPIAMNCSGKHAGMLATSVANGWEVERYRDPEHPVQLAITQTLDDLSGELAGSVAVDGCGAPLYAISLAGLARAYARLGRGDDPAADRVARAVREHPQWTSGTTRDEYALHQALPGVVTKAGAEAVQAALLPDGRAVALKIADGYPRARPVLMAAVLQALGYDHPTLDAQAATPVLGHGEPVGAIRPVAGALAPLRS